jgi:hypothetical protein
MDRSLVKDYFQAWIAYTVTTKGQRQYDKASRISNRLLE